jgi:hypothetical protein
MILTAERRVTLHRRALWLEYFTVGWNVAEAVVAIGAGIIAGSVALIGFGADSAIEVVSAVGLLWRLRKAGPHAPVGEESTAEKRALYVVAITFFLLALYITWEARKSPLSWPCCRWRSCRLSRSSRAGRQGDGKPRPGGGLQGDVGLLLPLAEPAARCRRYEALG